MAELKPKKIDENTVAYHDKLTNDPIAIVRRIKPTYGTKYTYAAEWHPVMKELYPEETASFKHMNIPDADSASTIQNYITGSYRELLDQQKPDTVKTKYAGDMTKTWDDPETVQYTGSPVTRHYSQYHVIDNDNNHLATINVDNKMTHYIGVAAKDKTFRSNRDAHIEFIGQQPNDSQHTVLNTKNPGLDPVSLLNRVKHWQTVKSQEPKFIGMHQYSDAHSHHAVYSTKLSPEEATTEYVKHLKSIDLYKNHSFEHISPAMVIARHSGKTEFIDGAVNGKISHTKINAYPQDSYNLRPLNRVIE
jgi:hypothetical protein